MPAPGSSSRGRGGKFKKYTRGGGHHFSRDLQPVDSDGNLISMWSANAKKRGEKVDDEDSSSEEEEDEDDSDDAGPSGAAASTAEVSREERRAQKKARKQAAQSKGRVVEVGDLPSSDEDSEDEADLPANPNHSKAARKQATAPVGGDDDEDGDGVDGVADGVAKMKMPASRREREAVEAQAAKERYMKLHAAGKTDEAKADLARLKAIREQRATEAARRQAEKEEREEQEKSRRQEIEAREAKRREAAAGPKKPKKK